MKRGLSVFLQQPSKGRSDSFPLSHASCMLHWWLLVSLLLFPRSFLQRSFLPMPFPVLICLSATESWHTCLGHCSTAVHFFCLHFTPHLTEKEIMASILPLLQIFNMKTTVITKTLGYSLLSPSNSKPITELCIFSTSTERPETSH